MTSYVKIKTYVPLSVITDKLEILLLWYNENIDKNTAIVANVNTFAKIT